MSLEGDLIRTELSKAGVFIWAEEVEVNLAKFQVVTSTGVPMRNSFVITQSAYYNPLGVGHTDRDGWVRIPVYKADRNVIGLFVDCNPIIYNKDYYIDEALDGEVYVGADPFVVDENDFNIITGQAIDCDGNAINNALVEHNKRGPRYVPVDDEGKFQLVVADCVESRDYNVLDLNRGGQSKTRSIVIKSDVDLHEVIICDETEYFVNIENNAAYYLFDSNQSFNSNKNGSIYEGTITAQGQSTNSEISIHFTSDKAFEQGSYSVSTWKVVNSNGGAQLNEDCSADCEGTLRINEINTSFVEGVLVIKNLPNNEEYTGVFRLPIQ